MIFYELAVVLSEVIARRYTKVCIQMWCMFVRASLYNRREENELDATEYFIALIICSTCFGHVYAHHQEIETIIVWLLHMVCNALVVGVRRSGLGQQAVRPGWGNLLKQLPSSSWFSSLRLCIQIYKNFEYCWRFCYGIYTFLSG